MATYDERYRAVKDVFGNEPEQFLRQYRGELPPDLPVLDIGAGQGRNTLYLARHGFQMDALDPAPAAIEIITVAAQAAGLPIRTYTCGFADFSPDIPAYGGVLLIGLIQIITPEARAGLLNQLTSWLAPGGLIFATAFTTNDPTYVEHRNNWRAIAPNSYADEGGEVRTYLEPGEILRIFDGYQVIHHWEGLGPPHHHGDRALERHAVVVAVLRRPGQP